MANYVLLETIELTQTATSITFDNLPTSGYTDLKIVASVRGTGSSNYIGTNILLNGTSASTNWGRLQIEGGDAAVNAYTSTSSSGGYFPDGNFTANAFGTAIYYLPNYRSSNYKTINVESAGEASSTTAVYIDMFSQTWTNTAAITSITMGNATSALAVGCTFSLYGIAATGTTPVIAPKATGGNIVANDGTYWYHAFLTSGTFTPQVDLTANVLVIAGGGAGGSEVGGGGGAGGLLAFTSQSLTATGYTCTVGAGAARSSGSVNGSNGSDSQFGSLTLVKGGGGGTYFGATTGLTGGSGGGGGRISTGGSATSGQGNPGARGWYRGNGEGGGGGGAGGAGNESSVSNVGGTGGIGSASYSAWGLATSTGENSSGTYYYAGGGGGGNELGTTSAAGGLGGGGAGGHNGGTTTQATNAIANTGGGGGGGMGTASAQGGAGGSGIIIIRYAM